jgi:hypothetical protein
VIGWLRTLHCHTAHVELSVLRYRGCISRKHSRMMTCDWLCNLQMHFPTPRCNFHFQDFAYVLRDRFVKFSTSLVLFLCMSESGLSKRTMNPFPVLITPRCHVFLFSFTSLVLTLLTTTTQKHWSRPRGIVVPSLPIPEGTLTQLPVEPQS